MHQRRTAVVSAVRAIRLIAARVRAVRGRRFAAETDRGPELKHRSAQRSDAV